MKLSENHQWDSQQLLTDIEDNLRIYQSINVIFKKLMREDKIQMITNDLREILSHEIKFAVQHLSRKNEDSANELKSQAYRNIFIFKENLKAITSMISKLKSRQSLEKWSQTWEAARDSFGKPKANQLWHKGREWRYLSWYRSLWRVSKKKPWFEFDKSFSL